MSAHNIETISRLSPLQEGILFHVIEASVPGVYLEQYSCQLEGELEVGRLESAWAEVALRHPALRSLFTWERREHPLQIVRERVTLPWHHEDWRGIDASEQSRRWQSHVARDRDRGFDITEAPLLRLALFRLDANRFRLLWSFHHLLLDGWSMRVVLDEVWAVYRAGSAAAAGLPPARAFPTFIDWLANRDKRAAEAFWRRSLEGFDTPVCPDLASAGSRSAAIGARVVARKTVAAAVLEKLVACARRDRMTLSTLVFGAWGIVLGRYTGFADVVFGVTVSGRPPELPDASAIVGLLINTLPLRVHIDEARPRSEWLRELQSFLVKARAHEHTPLVDIQRWSSTGTGVPLFETIVVFESFPARAAQGPGPRLVVGGEEYFEYSHFPLALLVVPGETMELLCVHDPGRFETASVQRLLDHVATTLESLSEEGNATLGDVSVLPGAEADRLRGVLAGPMEKASPQDALAAIRDVAARSADAPAIVSGDETLTYADLVGRAAALTETLRALEIGPGHCVPVVVERSANALVAALGVLGAGAGYSLVDAGLPSGRIQQILADLAAGDASAGLKCAPVFLVASDAAEAAPKAGLEPLPIAGTGATTASSSEPSLQAGDDLAYVIHTSGSTGRPKGVKISRRNLAHSLRARADFYDQAPGRYLLISPIATDSAIVGLYWPLVAGGTLVLAPPRLEQDVLHLAATIQRHEITHLLCLPSLYGLLLEYAPPGSLASLTTVIVAGEACSTDVVDRHAKVLSHARLYNEYGPAEATVWASAVELDATDVARRGFVPIGRAIRNARAYVVNARQQLLPSGVAGELVIGGEGVGLGYWNDPAATEARFVRDPFAGGSAWMYRTGDRVRLHEDGQLEFAGRIDNQVKIRGHRVEPEEIEGVLRTHPGVREVVVIAAHPHGSPHRDTGDNGLALLRDLLALGEEKAASLVERLMRLSDREVGEALKDAGSRRNAQSGAAS